MKIGAKAKFIDLLEKSIIIQGILTLGVVGTCLYLFIVGKDVPSTLIQWAGFMLGLYGAGKVSTLSKGSDTK
ncbi:MAG: hypothetical protein GWN13_03800 [Phycisphaerae bacterium]|nr:hypothetical protein [Phycisphaerae bacterium]